MVDGGPVLGQQAPEEEASRQGEEGPARELDGRTLAQVQRGKEVDRSVVQDVIERLLNERLGLPHVEKRPPILPVVRRVRLALPRCARPR